MVPFGRQTFQTNSSYSKISQLTAPTNIASKPLTTDFTWCFAMLEASLTLKKMKSVSEPNTKTYQLTTFVGFPDIVLSLAGLLLTFLVYASLSELKTRQDRCVMSFSLTLACFYAQILPMYLQWSPRDLSCTVSYYLRTYLAYSCLLWIHVMSFDIWRAIR